MAKPGYFRWNPAEAEADEDWRRMDVAQIGLFMVLLNYGWSNKGLPIEPFDIWRVIPLKIERKLFEKLWAGLVESKFPVSGDRRRNQRQEIERALAEQVSASRADAARAKHKKNIGEGSAIAEQMSRGFAEQTHLYSPSNLNLKSDKGSAEGTGPPPVKAATKKRAAEDYETVVGELAADPAYQGIDVPRESAKCVVWCKSKHYGAPSRLRLVKWLNRIDIPLMNGHGPPIESLSSEEQLAIHDRKLAEKRGSYETH